MQFLCETPLMLERQPHGVHEHVQPYLLEAVSPGNSLSGLGSRRGLGSFRVTRGSFQVGVKDTSGQAVVEEGKQ